MRIFDRWRKKKSETEILAQRYGVRFHDPERDLLGGESYTRADIRALERERMPRRRRR